MISCPASPALPPEAVFYTRRRWAKFSMPSTSIRRGKIRGRTGRNPRRTASGRNRRSLSRAVGYWLLAKAGGKNRQKQGQPELRGFFPRLRRGQRTAPAYATSQPLHPARLALSRHAAGESTGARRSPRTRTARRTCACCARTCPTPAPDCWAGA